MKEPAKMTQIPSPRPTTSRRHLLLLLASMVSLAIGAGMAPYHPIASLMLPPFYGLIMLSGITLDSAAGNRWLGQSETETLALVASLASICAPLGAIGTLIAT